RRLDSQGYLTPLPADDIERLWRRLHARDARPFAPPDEEEVRAWHRQALQELESTDPPRREWFALRWRLDRLLAEAPADPALRLRRAGACLVLGEFADAWDDLDHALAVQYKSWKIWKLRNVAAPGR